ncbi:MAG: histidine--tRNA ligase [Levilactobacillus sp.]|jgi:histidyl-tRNA synthetase|uniref:histidine--tRNA ligase n=1 Tax=Levilactobacillus sp. TaxID=2767919 RepID=UPI00258808CA|nr:histidine--tRNA ligase [Levilactobacillus sp.]MCI1554454.1 histidine--tRNA ligase [Levilactobacillus sp.]MCI1598215.1 histidine--tRNA ligase [Levilactobacillus sp.]
MSFQKPKGTVDILPSEVKTWQKIEGTARRVFSQYGYQGIRTPMFESYDVFVRSVGDTSDIVTKEMYDFEDKGGRRITLRPEGTAGVVRAYNENKLYGPEFPKPYKVYYMGPMFRYERPQSGRQREFHQIGVEALNSESPQVDVEVIDMALNLFKNYGVSNVKLVINSLGNDATRDSYRQALIDYLKPFYEKLSPDSQERLYKNPLRVLDSKDETDQKIVEKAPSILDYLDDYSSKYFEDVKRLLDELGIKYEVDSSMVRGLDYYTHTIFEIMSDSKAFGGKYTTVCAGGRYNGLMKELGGPEGGGIGFGLGVERLILLMQQENPDFSDETGLDVFITSADDKGNDLAFKLMHDLRMQGLKVDKDYEGVKLSTQIKEANRQNAKYYIVLGSNEVQSGKVTVNKFDSDEEINTSIDELKSNAVQLLK